MISVYAHVDRKTVVAGELRESENGKCAALSTGDLTIFIHSREKALEIASLLEQAAQKWEGES